MIVTSKWYEHMCSWAQWLKTWCYQKCLSIAQHRKWLFYNGILSADFSANMFVNFFREKRLLAVDKYIGIVAGGGGGEGPAQITAIAAYITFCPPKMELLPTPMWINTHPLDSVVQRSIWWMAKNQQSVICTI